MSSLIAVVSSSSANDEQQLSRLKSKPANIWADTIASTGNSFIADTANNAEKFAKELLSRIGHIESKSYSLPLVNNAAGGTGSRQQCLTLSQTVQHALNGIFETQYQKGIDNCRYRYSDNTRVALKDIPNDIKNTKAYKDDHTDFTTRLKRQCESQCRHIQQIMSTVVAH